MEYVDLMKSFLGEQHENHPYRLYIFSFLLVFVIYRIFFKKKRSRKRPARSRKRIQLSKSEVDEACKNWKPEPIIPKDWKPKPYQPKCIIGGVRPRTNYEGYKENTINFSSYNFLGYNLHPYIEKKSKAAIKKYGVGSCGPRGFYGTYDVHIDSEDEIAKFLKMDDCLIYSFGMSVGASAVPCYFGRGDYVLIDEGCGFGMQSGAVISKANVFKFGHNDLEDLEKKMMEIDKICLGLKKLPRKVLLVQGVYETTGDICKDFDKMVKLAKEFKFYILLDDSFAFGILGQNGRGTCEHYNVNCRDVDFIIGSLEYSLSSYGGFCCGNKTLVRYQRFFGYGYMFSCSLPPYTSVATMAALKLLQEDKDNEVLSKLKFNTKLMIDALKNGLGEKQNPCYRLGCHYSSPIIHIFFDCLDDVDELRPYEEELLREGVSVAVPEYSGRDFVKYKPSFRLAISAGHTKEDIEEGAKKIVETIKKVASKSMKKLNDEVKDQLEGKDF